MTDESAVTSDFPQEELKGEHFCQALRQLKERSSNEPQVPESGSK